MLSLMQYHRAVYSEKFNILYFSVPKNASSTIHYWIIQNHNLVDAYSECIKEGSTTHACCRRHLGIKRQVDFAGVSSFIEERNPFSFAVVRNPWHRLVSCYLSKFLRPTKLETFAQEITSHYCAKADERITFNQLVDYVSHVDDADIDPHLMSQHCFIPVIPNLNYYTIENLDTLVEHLASRCSFHCSVELNRNQSHILVNPYEIDNFGDVSSRILSTSLGQVIPYSKYYSGDSIKKISERYATDINRFGFSFY